MLYGMGIDGFGNWLAGFIDGEGCFLIPYRRDRDHWYCQFRIRVRADDGPIIREIYATTGFGRVFVHGARSLETPLACWEVSSRSDCLRLVHFLDRYPLRAKKAQDYALWREAVLLWVTTTRGGNLEARRAANTDQWGRISELSARLKAQRRFSPAT